MLKVGITGGIGSGKTTVARIFEVLGVPVFYADTIAKQIMATDLILMEGIRTTFGSESYTDTGLLNNKHIANIVFNDAVKLQALNALVHPAVFRAFDLWIASLPVSTPYILKEAALLFESDSYKMCDTSILVLAPRELKLCRVMDRDNVSEEQVKSRMDKQFTDEEKLKLADHQIYNDESRSVILQVMNLHKRFSTIN
jgi:dephospho-CoA kinase